MARREIPQQWRILMDRRGISSLRKLSEKAGISHVTVNRVVFQDGHFTEEENLQKIAEALGVDYTVVYALAGRPAHRIEKWQPPASAARLSVEDRELVERLIERLAGSRQSAVTEQPEIVHPERDVYDLAAYRDHGPSRGQLDWEEAQRRGEESQE